MIFTPAIYPPLKVNATLVYLFPILIVVIPAAIMIVLALCDQVVRYAIPVRIMFVLAGAVLPSLAIFFFLNGALDRKPPVEAQGLVSSKQITEGEYGGPDLFLSLAWNNGRTELTVRVSQETFAIAEPGDSVRVAIYQGAFSSPWSGRAVLSNGHGEIRLNSR